MDMDRIQIRESQSDYYNSRTATVGVPRVDAHYMSTTLVHTFSAEYDKTNEALLETTASNGKTTQHVLPYQTSSAKK